VGQASPTGTGRYYALVIGNNAYTSLPRLKTAEADARVVAALLKDAYGFETKLLLNATRSQIVSALSSYRLLVEPDANLLIYYAGHGINDKEADKAYWLPIDADRDDNSNWIIADEITTGIKVIPARHVLVISDSCYSGTLTRGLGESLPRPTERDQFLKRMAAGRSRTLMASGGDEPVADGGGGGQHSIFANALLRGLREMDKGQFTAAELFRYHVEEAVAGRANQTPEYNPLRNSGHEAGDFVFVRVKTGSKTGEMAINPPEVQPRHTVEPLTIELAYWDSIKNSADPEDFKDYLEKYPNGQFAAIARRRAQLTNNVAPAATETAEAKIEQAVASLKTLGSLRFEIGRFGENISNTSIIGRCQIKVEEHVLWNSQAKYKPTVIIREISLPNVNIASIVIFEAKYPDRPALWIVQARTVPERTFTFSITGYENRRLEKVKVPTQTAHVTFSDVVAFDNNEAALRFAKAFADAARLCGAKSNTF
jgi:uncharacterized caspase-like protein